MKQENPGSFFDVRTIITMVLMGITFIGWQAYLQRKYPHAYKSKGSVSAPEVAGEPTGKADAADTAVKTSPASPAAVPVLSAPIEEKLTPFRSETISFAISSKGMGLKDIMILEYKDRQGRTVQLGHPTENALPLETRLLGRAEPLDFTVEKVNDTLFIGRASIGDLKVTKAMSLDPEKYLLNFKVSVTGSDSRFVGLTTVLSEEVNVPAKTHFLLPQLQNQEFYVDTAETHTREIFSQDNDLEKTWSKVKLASIGSQYFTQAVIDNSAVMPEAKAFVNHKNDAAQVLMQHSVLSPGQEFNLEYSAYVGPKSFSLLRSIDPALAGVVDFGFFNWIARQIFALLRWFHHLVGNWGLAIICLTLVVRFCVLPFNLYSYKSMKAMQTLQPQIQALKERYKDDQQKQQGEIMRLMRENKVNPIGGCLPVLLQFPIFIALYQVLGHSVELYQAPFALWIHDLSLKDPYYVLPVLMGLTMFIQQKTAPNTSMDPAQAKILLMMPLIFTFFMVSLPSGLTLYMLVGSIFSVVQQAIMNSSAAASTGT